MKKRAELIVLMCVLALPLSQRAMAISTLEDTLSSLPRILRTPSTVPPNNALHRYIGRPQQRLRSGNGSNPKLPIPDEGPGLDSLPVAVGAGLVPAVVAISESENLQNDYLCAGILVDPSWVLTAAHCTYLVTRRWPSDLTPVVFVDTLNLGSPGRVFTIQEIVPHPKYDALTLRNDLALLKIDTRNAGVGPPERLDGPPIADQVGEIGTIVGWGISTNVAEQQHSERLQLVQAAILDDGVCFSPSNFPALRNTGVFCARSLLTHHDVCFRFGGSPMILIDNKGHRYLAGMVSWPADCPADKRKPSIYLDIQFYVPWIKSVIIDKASN